MVDDITPPPESSRGPGPGSPHPTKPCPHVLEPNGSTLALLEMHDPVSLARVQLEYAHGVATASVAAYGKLVSLLKKPESPQRQGGVPPPE